MLIPVTTALHVLTGGCRQTGCLGHGRLGLRQVLWNTVRGRSRVSSTSPKKEPAVNGLMMNFQLTLPHILQRAETFFGAKEIVTRLPDKSFHRYTYADFAARARRLASALHGLGLEDGARVA